MSSSHAISRRGLLASAGAALTLPFLPAAADAARYRNGPIPRNLHVIPELIPDELDRPLSGRWVMACDGSGSVDAEEFQRQIEGIVMFLRSPDLEEYIYCNGPLGFGTVQYGDAAMQGAGYGILCNKEDADLMAERILLFYKAVQGNTNLNHGIGTSADVINLCPFESRGADYIFVMGDGANNARRPDDPMVATSALVKDLGERFGITVHGIALDRSIEPHFRTQVRTPEGLVRTDTGPRYGYGVEPGRSWVASEPVDIASVIGGNLRCLIARPEVPFSQQFG